MIKLSTNGSQVGGKFDRIEVRGKNATIKDVVVEGDGVALYSNYNCSGLVVEDSTFISHTNNAVKLIADNIGGEIEGIVFKNCKFLGGRMAMELQNHGLPLTPPAEGVPKEWYKIDKFLHRVPYDKVPDVYRQCHILIKSSVLESFSYPPLEMMATGGCVVVVPNGGNKEYIKDGYNCLTYESGNLDEAIEKIRSLNDVSTREKLVVGGIETSEQRSWSSIRKEILNMYGIS